MVQSTKTTAFKMNDDMVQYETFACVDENMVCSPSHFFKLSGKICEEYGDKEFGGHSGS